MPISDFDFDKWVDSLQVPAELKTKFKEIGESAEGKRALAESVMLRSDYSRHLNELKTQEDAVKEKQQALTELEKTYREGGTRTQAELDQYKQANTELRRQIFDAQEKLRSTYGEGVDIDTVIKDIGLDKVREPDKSVPKPDSAPAFDSSKFLSVEEAENLRGAALIWPAMLQKFHIEHQQIFTKKEDKAFDPVEFTMEVNKQKKDPSLVYDEMYGATARRKELERASIEADVRSKLEAEYQAKVDALGSAGQMPMQSLDEHDPFTEAIKSILPEQGKEMGPLTPVERGGIAGIEQAREVRQRIIAGQQTGT